MTYTYVYDDETFFEVSRYIKLYLSDTKREGAVYKLDKLSGVLWDIHQYAILSGETSEKMELLMNRMVELVNGLKLECSALNMDVNQFITELDEVDEALYG